jgi:hypothetical protein
MIEYEKFIYLDVYKTGSTHIASLLKSTVRGKPVRRIRHAPLTAGRPFSRKGGKLVFATVRNPWDWYVSYWAYSLSEDKAFYQHVLKASGADIAKKLYDKSNPKESFGLWMRAIHDPVFLSKATENNRLSTSGLADLLGLYSYRFMRVTTPYPAIFLRRFFMPNMDRAIAWQKRWAFYDVVFKSENLDADFRAFVRDNGERLGFVNNAVDILDNENATHKNTSERVLASYRDYYDDELRDIVARRDRLIIDLFDYQF